MIQDDRKSYENCCGNFKFLLNFTYAWYYLLFLVADIENGSVNGSS